MSESTLVPPLSSRLANVYRAVATVDGRQLRHYLCRMGVPERAVPPLVSGMKRIARPRDYMKRRHLLSRLPRADIPVGAFDSKAGFGRIEANQIPGGREVIKQLLAIFDERRERLENDPQKKNFLRVFFAADDLQDHPSVLGFCLNPVFVDIAARYLGQVPVLANAQGWWSPVNEDRRSSQLYHLDGVDKTQLKIFVNLSDIDQESGPLTFISATDSDKVLQTGLPNVRGRMQDEEVYNAIGGEERAMQATGPTGTIHFVDTGRCYHYGSRVSKRDRLILQIQFVRSQCPYEPNRSIKPNQTWPIELDEFQSLMLRASQSRH